MLRWRSSWLPLGVPAGAECDAYRTLVVITWLGNAELLRSAGVRRIEEHWWQQATTTPLSVTLTPAHHLSARDPFERNRALWGWFVIGIAGDVLVSEVIRRNELQVWFLAEHVVDVPRPARDRCVRM